MSDPVLFPCRASSACVTDLPFNGFLPFQTYTGEPLNPTMPRPQTMRWRSSVSSPNGSSGAWQADSTYTEPWFPYARPELIMGGPTYTSPQGVLTAGIATLRGGSPIPNGDIHTIGWDAGNASVTASFTSGSESSFLAAHQSYITDNRTLGLPDAVEVIPEDGPHTTNKFLCEVFLSIRNHEGRLETTTTSTKNTTRIFCLYVNAGTYGDDGEIDISFPTFVLNTAGQYGVIPGHGGELVLELIDPMTQEEFRAKVQAKHDHFVQLFEDGTDPAIDRKMKGGVLYNWFTEGFSLVHNRLEFGFRKAWLAPTVNLPDDGGQRCMLHAGGWRFKRDWASLMVTTAWATWTGEYKQLVTSPIVSGDHILLSTDGGAAGAVHDIRLDAFTTQPQGDSVGDSVNLFEVVPREAAHGMLRATEIALAKNPKMTLLAQGSYHTEDIGQNYVQVEGGTHLYEHNVGLNPGPFLRCSYEVPWTSPFVDGGNACVHYHAQRHVT